MRSRASSGCLPEALRLARWSTIEDMIAGAVSVIAAGLLVILIALLLGGVLARYVFSAPIAWTDELASMLFLWLAMLGTALAARRGVHMRMTSRTRARRTDAHDTLPAFCEFFSLATLLCLLIPAWKYAEDASAITTSALEIADSWRASAMFVGLALTTLFVAARLINALAREHSYRSLALALALAAMIICAGLLFRQQQRLVLILFLFVGAGSLVMLGVPIWCSFGLATVGFIGLATRVPLTAVIGRMDEGMSQLMLLAIPTFVFLGLLLEMTGMARAMIQLLGGLVGHLRGGLSYVLVGAMYLVSGISGSKAADMAAVAPALFPEMTKRGEDSGELVALLAATGAQTETVPPSIVLITVGAVAGVSISALFSAGILPSLVLGVSLCMMVAWRYRHMERGQRTPANEVARLAMKALPALILPFVIRFVVLEGVATATEVSTVGIAYVLLIGALLFGPLPWRRLGRLLIRTAVLSGAILAIIGSASAMAWALTQSGAAQDLGRWMSRLPGGGQTFMALSITLFAVLGSVLEGVPAIVLLAPILFPVARSLGLSDVHYAVTIILSMGLGLFSPPFGVGYYTACAVAGVDPEKGMPAIWRYMAVLLAGVVVVAFVPGLSTAWGHS